MRTNLTLIAVLFFALIAGPGSMTGCEEKNPAATASSKNSDHEHDHGTGSSHSHDKPAGPASGHGGPVIALGEQAVGPFMVKATRDAGEILAGKDAAFDLTITPKDGAGLKANAVRIWIGAQDAKGSVKVKAEIENLEHKDRWHAHAEVPNPIPTGSMLWFEIEDDKAGQHVGSFDLKQ